MFKRVAWGMIKPLLVDWLRTRALVIPVARRREIARKHGASEEVVEAIEVTLREQALAEVEKFKP